MTRPMDSLLQLAERVERAEGPDRELDALIYANQLGDVEWIGNMLRAGGVNLGFVDPGKHQRNFTLMFPHTPTYTASLDAVRTLIDPADEFEITTLYSVARAAVGLNRFDGDAHGEHLGADPVLAFLAAALRARALTQETAHANVS